MSTSESNSAGKPTRRWWRIVIPLLLLVALAPTIISKTPLGDWLINAALADDSFQASTRKVSLGYLTPLSIEGFRLQAVDGSMQLDVDEMNADKSWLQMLLSGDDLGTFRFRDPLVEIVTGITAEEEQAEQPQDAAAGESAKSLPTLTAEIIGAGVSVRDAELQEPTIDLRDLSFVVRVEQRQQGSFVVMDPTLILDDQPLTPQLCKQGVQLIAPLLADVTDVEGHLSFRIDKFVVPVGGAATDQQRPSADISGMLKLSELSVRPNERIMGGLLPLIKQIASIDREIVLMVTRTMEVNFQVINERVHHQGLAFMLPIADNAFEIKSSGSVGFDETLDLRLSVDFPQQLRSEGLVGRLLAGGPLAFRVTGTIDRPKINLDRADQVAGPLEGLLREVLRPESGDADDQAKGEDTAEAVLGIVDGILNELAEPREQRLLPRRETEPGERRLLPRLRDRLRDRRDQQDDAPTPDENATPTPI